MPTSYTSLIGLAKPQTGELAGTWGDVVNDYLTTYVDAAVAGTQVISGSQTAVTLTVANGAALTQAAGTSAGSSQYQIILCSGNPGGTLTITAPADSRTYVVINATSTNQSVVVRGATPTTGVTIGALTRALVAWNGSDYALIASNRITDLTGTLATGNGGTGLTSFTSGGAVYASSTSALTTGTLPTTGGGTGLTSFTSGGAVYASSTSALTTGTLPVASGGTGATSLTANNVILGNGTSAVQVVAPSTTGNVLTSNGTTWTSAAAVSPGVKATVYTSGTSQTFTIPSGVTAIKATIIGGGGGGAGTDTICPTGNGGGGGGGGSSIVYLTGLTPGGTITYTVGAGGTAGATDANGGSGGTSSITVGATTYSATGGSGGVTGGNGGNGGDSSGTAGAITSKGGTGFPGTGSFTYGGGTILSPSGNAAGRGGGGQGSTGSGSTAGVAGVIVFEY